MNTTHQWGKGINTQNLRRSSYHTDGARTKKHHLSLNFSENKNIVLNPTGKEEQEPAKEVHRCCGR